MNVWNSIEWQLNLNSSNSDIRSGLYLKIDKEVHDEVRRACKEFAAWARTHYEFPIRLIIYIRDTYRIQAKDGDMVCGTFFWTNNRTDEPYIRLAVGDYEELLNEEGQDNALASILYTFIHEITHYFQWLNDVKQSDEILEENAEIDSNEVFELYASTREHP